MTMLRGRRSGQGEPAVSGSRAAREIPARLERLGGFRQTHGERQADSGERSAPGLVHSVDLVSSASPSAGPGRERRFTARPALRDHRPQSAHRLGRHQSRVRRSGSVHREDRSADRALPVSRPSGAGALGIGMDSREGRAAGGIPPVGDAARAGGVRGEWPLFRAALGGGGTRTGLLFRFWIWIARKTGASSPRRSPVILALARISFTPTWTATSATTRPACFRSARISTATCRWTAARGDFEWDGYIPFDQLPAFYNPAARLDRHRQSESIPGKLSLSRERRVRRAVSFERDSRPPHRAHRVEAAGHAGGAEGRLFLVFESSGAQIVAAYDRKKPAQAGIAGRSGGQLLRSWNGQMEKRTAAPLLITLAYNQLRRAAVHAAWPGATDSDIYQPYMAPAGDPEDCRIGRRWIFSRYRTRRCWTALAAAIEEGRRTQGSNLARWD